MTHNGKKAKFPHLVNTRIQGYVQTFQRSFHVPQSNHVALIDTFINSMRQIWDILYHFSPASFWHLSSNIRQPMILSWVQHSSSIVHLLVYHTGFSAWKHTKFILQLLYQRRAWHPSREDSQASNSTVLGLQSTHPELRKALGLSTSSILAKEKSMYLLSWD